MEPDALLAEEHPQRRLSRFRRCLLFVRRFFVWFLLVALALWSYGFYELGRYVVYQENPELAGQQLATDTLNKVGQLIQLPADETPTMATIKNAASIKQTQPFLADAEDGDILIVYSNAKIAILYRPSENKLIAVGPVTSVSGSPQAQQPITVTSDSATTTATTKNDTSTQKK